MKVPKRKMLLGAVVVLVLALGWRYPLFGMVVPLVVLTGLTVSLFRGRYFCGNWCPRGAFLDSLPVPPQRWRNLPALLRNDFFRWLLVGVLFSVMIGRGLQNPGSLHHWGLVFWQMCLLTTVIALLLAVFIRPRAWCAVCPVGTLQRTLGNGRRPFTIDSRCRECGLCERVCPLELSIRKDVKVGFIQSPDCLKCGRCREVCPIGAIGPSPVAKN